MSKALIISLQYNDFPHAKLNGCFYDGERFAEQIKLINKNIEIINMRDDLPQDSDLFPTKDNIVKQLTTLCESNIKKLYFYFSGHGSYTNDLDNDELSTIYTKNGYNNLIKNTLLKDSCLVTNDKKSLNLLVDDEIYIILKKLKRNQTLYSFTDCCHSGTIMDLCYLNVGDLQRKIYYNKPWQLIYNSIVHCPVSQSYYPNKRNEIKGNVILISGCRDNAYSYESEVNKKVQGHFTTALIKALKLGLHKYSLKIFYACIIGLINDKYQIPVLTTSQNLNLNKYKMVNLNTKTKLSHKQKILLLKQKKHY